MTLSLRVAVVGDTEWKTTLKTSRREMGKELEKAVLRGLLQIEGGAKRNLDNSILNRRTSTLFRSVHHRMAAQGLDSHGEVGTPIIYGRVHEEGATITPKQAQYLRFKTDRGWVSTKRVTIPKRPWLGPAFEDARDAILNDLRRALQRGLDAA